MTKRPLIALTMATAMAFTTLTSVSPLPALAQPAGATSPVVINEVESNGDEVSDWFELVNTGKVAVDISG
ncbi:lamin tail domain-containing protein [Corynebacterium gallinarum]|uniref:lamin tail domain-containing protein n=1 Tax=Corynebacterium gallinarum TaxID=2762214 RepID=UPI001CD886F1|nr:lamin tail domain-containing protein [Corynebacterium gallinarum]